jgi:hypothetical protein
MKFTQNQCIHYKLLYAYGQTDGAVSVGAPLRNIPGSLDSALLYFKYHVILLTYLWCHVNVC